MELPRTMIGAVIDTRMGSGVVVVDELDDKVVVEELEIVGLARLLIMMGSGDGAASGVLVVDGCGSTITAVTVGVGAATVGDGLGSAEVVGSTTGDGASVLVGVCTGLPWITGAGVAIVSADGGSERPAMPCAQLLQ